MRLLVFFIATFALAGLTAGVARADYTYTFKVPYSVSNVPPGSIVQIACALSSGPNNTLTMINSVAAPSITVTSASQSGTAVVPVPSPIAAASYFCNIQIISGGKTINITGGGKAYPPNWTLSPGWSGSTQITGNL